jgi:hypothetical protein
VRSSIFCVRTIISELPAVSFNAFCPVSPHAPSPSALWHPVLKPACLFPSAANLFRSDVDNSSFRNVGTYVLHIRCCISDNSVIGRSVVHYFSDPTQDGRQRVDRGPVYVNEGSNYVFLFRTQPSQLSSSSSSSSICHGVGPFVDPFRSHVSRSLFKGLP